MLSPGEFLNQLTELQDRILRAVRKAQVERSMAALSHAARDEPTGDTIFQIDIIAEEALLGFCEEWGRATSFRLVGEGISPAAGRGFGSGEPEFVLIVDPIDGSRGLMYDKRSGWCLSGVAPERGAATSLLNIRVAMMTELPVSRQDSSDRLWATPADQVRSARIDIQTGGSGPLMVRPNPATNLRHGFATVNNYFPGGKELTSRVEEEILAEAMGGWNPEKAEVYCDQYISAGGQLAEMVLGRDLFVLDIRPLVHRAIGATSSLCARPYDLCTALVARQAGCVVVGPDGGPLDPPLDVTTNVAFAAYANQDLAAMLQPIVSRVLEKHGLL